MENVKLFLLGAFAATRAAAPVGSMRRKTRALLAYLADTAEFHSRRQLTTLFCSEAADPQAAFRLLLSRIRRSMKADLIESDRARIRLLPAAATVDAREFAHVLSGSPAELSAEQLKSVLDLYRGEFLAGLSLNDAPEFNLWVLGRRARYRSLYERGLLALVDRLIEAAAWTDATAYAQKLVVSNSLLETGYARLIWLYARTGQVDAAHALYRQCRDLLANELGVEPSAEVETVYADVQAGKLQPLVPAAPAVPTALVQTAVSPPTAPDLVGREAEMACLSAAWQQAKAGQGRVLLLTAEGGGGKTHLMHSFGQQPDAGQFLMGEGYESAQAVPLAPWLELLETLLTSYSQEQLARLPPHVALPLAQLVPRLMMDAPQMRERQAALPELTTERLFAAVTAVLLDTPRLLFLDNLQWVDGASLQLFHFLARRVATSPTLLVGAYRAPIDNPALTALLDDLKRQQTERLELPALGPADVETYLAAHWEALPPGYRPHVARRLVHATGGNPLFVSEVVRNLATTDTVPDAFPVPPSVQDLIRRRLRRLPPHTRQIVETLAVLHNPARPGVLQQISGHSEDETWMALDTAVQDGLLQPHGDTQFDFRHDLIREAVTQQLTPLRLRLLHKRCAGALAQMDAAAAVLTYHWHHAGDTVQEARYAAEAGAGAYALYANEEAERYLQRALELDPQAATWRQLGRLWQRVGAWDDAESAYQESIRLAVNEKEQALAESALGGLYAEQGDYETAVPLLIAARDYFYGEHPGKLLSGVLIQLAEVYVRQGENERSLQTLQEAKSIAAASGDEATLAKCIGNIGVVYLQRGLLDEALHHLEDSLERYRRLDLPAEIANRLSNLGAVYSYRNEYDMALQHYHEAKKMAEELGDRAAVLRHTGNLGLEYHGKGDDASALRYLLEALEMARAMGNQRIVAIIVGNIGLITQDLGDFETAALCHRWSLQTDLAAQHPDAVGRHLANLGTIFQRQAQPRLAFRCYKRALTLLEQSQHPYFLAHVMLRMAELHWSQGKAERALVSLSKAEAVAAKWEQVDYLAAVHALRVQIEVAEGSLPPAAGREQIDEWLANGAVPALEQAFLWYTLWRITGEEPARRQAATCYAALHETKRHWLFRQRYLELTGEMLPPLPLPPLPNNLLPDDIPELDKLLAQVDAMLKVETD